MIRKRWPWLLYTFLVLSLVHCSQSGSGTEEEETRIPVKTMTVSRGEVLRTLDYSGDIEAEVEIRVFSKVPDRIEKLHVDAGDPVRKGDSIASIHATTLEQAVRQAEAGLMAARAQAANAQLEYDRATRLYRENAMSKQQYDAVNTQYEAAQAALEQTEAALKSAKSHLTDATVTAPIAGIIGVRYYEEGDMANPAMPLVTVVQMKRVKITFDATEEDLGQLSLGQKALLSVKSYPDREFEGRVMKISPVLDPLTRMAEVEVLIDNPDGALKPGMFARVQVITEVMANALVVPRYATIENTTLERIDGENVVMKNYYVFVVQDSAAEQRELDIEYANHINIAVRSGISAGEQIVIEGQNNLRDRSKVNIIAEEEVGL